MVTLQSSDGEIFEVGVSIMRQSIFLRDMFELLGVDDEDEDPLILPNVDAAILKKVIQWCTYHKVKICPSFTYNHTTCYNKYILFKFLYNCYILSITFVQQLLSTCLL